MEVGSWWIIHISALWAWPSFLICSFTSIDVLMGKIHVYICREQKENLSLELSEEMDWVNLPEREASVDTWGHSISDWDTFHSLKSVTQLWYLSHHLKKKRFWKWKLFFISSALFEAWDQSDRQCELELPGLPCPSFEKDEAIGPVLSYLCPFCRGDRMGGRWKRATGRGRRWGYFLCNSHTAWLEHQRENSVSFSL